MADRGNKISFRACLLAMATMALALAPAEVAGQAAGPYNFFALAPCRVVDTRGPVGPTGGPKLQANTSRNFPIVGLCGVPTTAAAVAMNVTIAAPTDFGDLRLSPAGQPIPLASVINWSTTDSAVANGAIIPMGTDGLGNHVTVHCDMPVGSTGQVHLIIDVTGYFAP